MGDNVLNNVVVVFSMIIGVAILAVLVSSGSQTSNVISSTFSGFSQVIGAAVAPVTGGATSIGSSSNNLVSSVSSLLTVPNLNAIAGLFNNNTSFDTNSGLHNASGFN